MWEIWFCDKSIIKISRRTFQPDKMPVYFIPFRRDPSSIFGIGAGESALECVEMLTNITRSIEDSLNDTSGYQAIIDASMVQDTDLKIQGRKVWIYRSKGHRGDDVNHKPVDFFSVPSNLEQLLACFKQFEAMVPICTGFLEMANGQDMGSGVRTDSMMNALWDSPGGVHQGRGRQRGRYLWKPFLRDTVEWIQEYYPRPGTVFGLGRPAGAWRARRAPARDHRPQGHGVLQGAAPVRHARLDRRSPVDQDHRRGAGHRGGARGADRRPVHARSST